MHLVRLIIKLLKRLRVEHTNEKVQRRIVRIRDDAEDGLLAFAQLAKLHIVAGRDALNFRQGERCETNSRAHQDRFCSFARGLLEDMVLPHGNVVRLFFLQCFKQQVKRRLIIVIFFLCTAIFNHVENGFHVLIFNRRFVEQVEHERGVKRGFGFLPERIVCFRTLWSGVLDEIIDQLEHVRVLAYVAKRVVAVRFCRIDQVEHTQHIALLQEQVSNSAEHFALWISDDKAGICKHKIWLRKKSRLTAAGATDDDLQQVSAVQFAVHTHLQVLGQYDVFACILVAVLLIQLPDTAPRRGAVFFAGSGVLLSGVVEQDRAAVEQ